MSARAIVSGVLFKAPIEKASKAGKPFATFTIRENLNGATRWWQAIAFSESAIEALKELTVGDPIAEIYAPAGSESRISWRITADAVLTARKTQMRKITHLGRPSEPKEGSSRKPKEANGRDRAEASKTGHSIAARSWASPARAEVETPRAENGAFDDSIPF
jgi:hypothetical protein